jgi:ribosomal protein L24
MLCDENGVTSRVGFTTQDNKKVRIFKKTNKLIS